MNYNRMVESPEDESGIPKPFDNNDHSTPPISQEAGQNEAETNPTDNRNNAAIINKGKKKYFIDAETDTVTILTETPLDLGYFIAFQLHRECVALSDKITQKLFMVSVCTVCLTQLLFTTSLVSFFYFDEAIKSFVKANRMMAAPAVLVNLIFVTMISCSETIRRKYPINLIVLIIFTILMALLLAIATSLLDHYLILIFIGMVAVHVIAMIIYLLQTKYKYTSWRCAGLVAIISLLAMVLSAIFLFDSFWEAALGIFLACNASWMLIFDVKCMVSGWHTYKLNPEEYICGALSLYLDSVSVFIHFVRCVKRTPVYYIAKHDLPLSLQTE